MMMRHRVLAVLFGLGALGGIGGGIASLRGHARQHHSRFERHVAHVCAEAAKNPASAPADDDWSW